MGAGLISRLRNFVSDKNANIPITSSYVDNELNQLVASLNSKVLSSASAPVSPVIGDTWIDTANLLVKFYNGSTWDTLLYLTSVLNQLKSADIASATTTNLATASGNYVVITGTTTITGFGIVAAGTQMVLKFDGILTLTHNGTSLILPSAANITTAAGDVAGFVSLGSGNWRCMWYQRASGYALIYPEAKVSGKAVGTSDITTASTSFVDMTDMSVTLTTTGGNLFCSFTAPMSTTADVADLSINILIDASQKTSMKVDSGTGSPFNTAQSIQWLETSLAGGSHTVKVQWKVSANTGNQFGSTNGPRVLTVIEV